MLVWRSPQHTLKVANQIAGDLLSTVNSAQEMLLFGSVARGEQRSSSDIDLICVVPEHPYQQWLEQVRTHYPDLYPTAQRVKEVRLQAAASVLQTPHLSRGPGPTPVDIFLFPEDWKSRLEELQVEGGHADPMFMQKLKGDAVRFDEQANSFLAAAELLDHHEQQERRSLALSLGVTVDERGNGKSPYLLSLMKKSWHVDKRKQAGPAVT